jgi:hypothetical protein
MSRAVDLAELGASLARRGVRLDEAAARHLGGSVARALADAHATIDADGNLAPVVHGRLGARDVRIDEDGEVSVLGLGEAAREGIRATPRDDVLALGTLLRPLFEASRDAELAAALAIATEARIERRKITCVEFDAWLSRSADREAGKRALAAQVRAALAGRDTTAPLLAGARVGVAAVTAAVVFGAGVLVIERCAR